VSVSVCECACVCELWFVCVFVCVGKAAYVHARERGCVYVYVCVQVCESVGGCLSVSECVCEM